MSDLAYELQASLKGLDSEWDQAQRGWRDDSVREFESDCWFNLQDEAVAMVDAAEALLRVLDVAAKVARR